MRDAAYAAVGFGVLGFQRAQVRRRELARQLQVEGRLHEARSQLGDLARELDERARPLVSQVVQPLLDDAEARLPPVPRELVSRSRQAARAARGGLLDLLGADAPSTGVEAGRDVLEGGAQGVVEGDPGLPPRGGPQA